MDYTIKQGDTLSDIARRNHTTVQKLAEANHIANPDLIVAGATLQVDDPTTAPNSTQAATAAASGASAGGASPSATSPGDTAQISQQAQGEIPTYHATDLGDVTRKAKEAQQAQQSQSTDPTQPTPTTQSTNAAQADNPAVTAVLASYQKHAQAIQQGLQQIQSTQDPAQQQAAEKIVLDNLAGAAQDYKGLSVLVPPDQIAGMKDQLVQLGTALASMGFPSDQVGGILKDAGIDANLSANQPAQAAKPAAPKPQHKSWFDKLVDKGESAISGTLGKIPLIGGLFTISAQLTGGALKAAGEMVAGIAGAILHPIRTLKGLWDLAAHIPFSPPNLLHIGNEALHGMGPSQILAEEGHYLKGVANGLTAGYQQSIHDGKWFEIPGRLVVDVGSLLIGAGEVGGAAKGLQAAGKAGEVSAVVGDASDAAKASQVADAAKAAEVVTDASKASDAAKVADVAKAGEAAKAARLATAVDAFKGTAVGKATLDVGAGMQLMGEGVSDFGKALAQSLKDSAGKLPVTELKQAESLSTRADALAKQFQEASKLQGPAAVEKMQALSKEASKLADESSKVAKSGKGLRGLANGLKARAEFTAEAFRTNGVAGRLGDIGAMAVETAKSMADVGVQVAKATARGVGKFPKAVLDQMGGLGDRVSALATRAKEATALKGQAAVDAYTAMADQAKGLAVQARELADKSGDLTLREAAQKLDAQALQFNKIAGGASLGLPLKSTSSGREAELAALGG